MQHEIRPNPDVGDLVTISRTAKVVAALMRGEGLTISQIRELTGLSRRGVYYLMNVLSGVLSLYCDNGVWQLIVLRELAEN